jgi:flavin-binding protein dodecin
MEQVYKKIELAGSSKESIEKAIENALERASKTIHQMRWFEVVDTRGYIEEGRVAYYQVTIKIGFSVDNPDLA